MVAQEWRSRSALADIARQLELDTPQQKRDDERNRRLRFTADELSAEGVARDVLVVVRDANAVLELAARLRRHLCVSSLGLADGLRRREGDALVLDLSNLAGLTISGNFGITELAVLAAHEGVEIVQLTQEIRTLEDRDHGDA